MDMKKRLSDDKYGLFALALAVFAAAGTAPALAQSSGTWSASISGRSGTPYVHTQSTNVGGYGAYGISARNIRPFVHASSTNRIDRIAPGKLASGPQGLAR
jgi:hypothetical protein